MGEASRTATEIAVKQEQQAKLLKVILLNRDVAWKRIGKMYIDNIQQFYPVKLVRELVPV